MVTIRYNEWSFKPGKTLAFLAIWPIFWVGYHQPGGYLRPQEGKELALRCGVGFGRKITVIERGPKNGYPVFYFHGLEGSRFEIDINGLNDEEYLLKNNIRLISLDRWGYGDSSHLTESEDRMKVIQILYDMNQL